VADVDWWQPIGEPGRLDVRELLSPAVWPRYFAADPDVELELGHADLRGRTLDFDARRPTRVVRCEGEVIAELDLFGPPDVTGGWQKAITILGTRGEGVLQTDESRTSRLRGALRYLQVTVGEHAWVWYFEGGRAAGERLVLARGNRPGQGAAVVGTHPAAQGRVLGNPKGGATTDTRVTSWEPAACVAEVGLAELLAMARLDALVDYRPARIADGISELLDVLPRSEGNTE
jgi:hypothetical protein